MPQDLGIRRKIRAIFALGFLFTLHGALPAYISSSFLSRFISEQSVGIIYTIGSVFSVLSFLAISAILKKYGNYRVMQFLMLFEVVAFIILTTSDSPALVTGAFIFSLVTGALISFNVDIFLEKYSTADTTGGIRGSFLSLLNLGWVMSQFLVSLILTDGDYWKVFIISTIIMIPVWLLSFNLKGFQDSPYTTVKVRSTVREIMINTNIYRILMSNIILQFFYAWMVIYIPLYLYKHIGLPWNQIGIILTIILLPFVLVEAPLGFLADKKWGEKEILTAGFILLSLSTASLSFIHSTNMWVWAIVLFITRIGAAMIESMNETYFFKKTSFDNANMLSFFRMTRPVAYIIAPLVASTLLLFSPLGSLFVILGIIILYGLRYSLTIEDTR